GSVRAAGHAARPRLGIRPSRSPQPTRPSPGRVHDERVRGHDDARRGPNSAALPRSRALRATHRTTLEKHAQTEAHRRDDGTQDGRGPGPRPRARRPRPKLGNPGGEAGDPGGEAGDFNCKIRYFQHKAAAVRGAVSVHEYSVVAALLERVRALARERSR